MKDKPLSTTNGSGITAVNVDVLLAQLDVKEQIERVSNLFKRKASPTGEKEPKL